MRGAPGRVTVAVAARGAAMGGAVPPGGAACGLQHLLVLAAFAAAAASDAAAVAGVFTSPVPPWPPLADASEAWPLLGNATALRVDGSSAGAVARRAARRARAARLQQLRLAQQPRFRAPA
jgi:hypothetical protein